MRIALIADVHANLEALEAVLRHAQARGPIDTIWHIGDIVGYGPDPCTVIARLREFRHCNVLGNHDLAAIGALPLTDFNANAAAAVRWTAAQLGGEERQYLQSLPKVRYEDNFTIVHGTLRWPEWEYLLSEETAMAQFNRQETPYSLVGHTHIPLLVEEPDQPPRPDEWVLPVLHFVTDGERCFLGERRLVLNPGGVGQPRDGDPRAAYALYDSDERVITFYRVEYDIAATQAKMRAAGLPRFLIERLSYGR